ncbi:MAG: Hint domain-containing protein [Paracoccaceae bacterium]
MSAFSKSAARKAARLGAAASVKTGLVGGVRVLGINGYQNIETLKAGDAVITRNGMRELRALRVREIKMRPLKLSKDVLGHDRPNSDMLVAPDQYVLVRDWRAPIMFGHEQVIVHLSRLIDGEYIARMDEEETYTVYDLVFDTEQVYYADGVEMVSSAVKTPHGTKGTQSAA